MAASSRKILFSPWRTAAPLWAAVLFTLALSLLQLLPLEGGAALRYERSGVMAGEWWRLLTGNFVHLGWRHLALNAGALLIGGLLFHTGRTTAAWAVAMVTCGLSANAGLLVFSPHIEWCVGLSGALHGLLVIGALDWIRQGDRLGIVLLAAWVAKIAWEQWQGGLPFSGETIGATVVTDAHLWGAVGGLAYSACESGFRRIRTQL